MQMVEISGAKSDASGIVSNMMTGGHPIVTVIGRHDVGDRNNIHDVACKKLLQGGRCCLSRVAGNCVIPYGM